MPVPEIEAVFVALAANFRFPPSLRGRSSVEPVALEGGVEPLPLLISEIGVGSVLRPGDWVDLQMGRL